MHDVGVAPLPGEGEGTGVGMAPLPGEGEGTGVGMAPLPGEGEGTGVGMAPVPGEGEGTGVCGGGGSHTAGMSTNTHCSFPPHSSLNLCPEKEFHYLQATVPTTMHF